MRRMKILITGASGNFGSRTVRGLLARVAADDLILVSRKPESLAEFARAGCRIRQGDFDQPATIEAAACGADRMLLISGHKVGYRVKQHGDAIEAAKRAGVQHIVYTSYFGSTAENTAMVCVDHFGTEQKLKISGVAWTAMRNGFYANSIVDAALPAAIRSGKWVSSSQDGKMSFVDRDDCVACAVHVLTSDGHANRVYNITGTDLWSFNDVAKLTTEITGTRIDYVRVTDDGLYRHLDALGIPRNALQEFNIDGYAWCSDDMVSYEREVRAGRFAITSHDIRSLIGRDPKPFRAFVEERAAWLKGIAAESAPK
jgi:NAD(P)H dehydrogenase (quinone)